MKKAMLVAAVVGVVGMSIAASKAQAAVLYDQFTDATAVSGAVVSQTTWYRSIDAGSVSVATNSTLPARGAANSNSLAHDATYAYRAIMAGFAAQSIATNGASIELSFDFRYTVAPGTQGAILRFGLYDDRGTLTTGNAQTSSTDDRGYYVNILSGTPGANTNLARRENGGLNYILSGNDFTSIGASNQTQVLAGDTAAHTGSLRLTKLANGVQILARIDGTEVLNVTDTGAALTSFNEVAFSNGSVLLSSQLILDNVAVVIPEPTSLAVTGLAAGLLCLRRRRQA